MTEQVNQTMNQVSEPIEQMGGSSPISFDDLESVSQLKTDKQSQSKEAKPKESKKDEGHESTEGKGKSEKQSEKGKESQSKDKEVDGQGLSVKLLKLKSGDQDVELRADTLVEVKVDGKIQKVTLQDALNGYSGQSHLTKQAAEHKKEKAAFEQERTGLSTNLNTIHDLLVNKKDLRGTIWHIAEKTNQDPQALWTETMGKVQAAMEQMQNMSPEERKAMQLEEENQFYRSREASQKESVKAKQEEQQHLTKIRQVQSNHSLTDEEFISHYEELVKLTGKNPDEITPEAVGRYAQLVRADEKARSLLKDVGAEETQIEDAAKEIRELSVKHPELSEDDLRNYALEVYGKESAKRLSKKVSKMTDKQTAKKPARNPSSDLMFFDDLS